MGDLVNIFFLGLVSFFTDISTEMIYPVIPLYLTGALGATPFLVGVIEGIAESLASLLKVYGGYVSDRFRVKKPIAFIGYAGGLVYKVALLFASGWAGILAAKIIDRTGKGIRTAPRDALVFESADKNKTGGAFGMHKALDMAGAAIGILITYFLLKGSYNAEGANGGYRNLFLVSIIPAVLGLFMFVFIKEKKRGAADTMTRPRFLKSFKTLDGRLKLYLLVVALFTLGNSSNAFLLLKAKAAGFDDISVILVYFLYNTTASVLSMPLGGLSDRVGRKALLVTGYAVFAFVYFGFAVAGSFAFSSGAAFIAGLFALYGVHTAMITGVERALVAEIAPPELKGTMLGLQSTVAGVALLPASVITGALWNAFGGGVPFVFGALLSAAAALILLIFMKQRRLEI